MIRRFQKKETADYSAITTWGVFKPNEGEPEAIILMDAQRGRWDFPELKAKALQEYTYWEPDMVIVEAKASGTPLTDELRATGVPVVNYTPSKGRDKHTRMHMVAPIFESGKVWAPERRFAEEGDSTNVRRFLMAIMTITVTVCRWHLLDIVKVDL